MSLTLRELMVVEKLGITVKSHSALLIFWSDATVEVQSHIHLIHLYMYYNVLVSVHIHIYIFLGAATDWTGFVFPIISLISSQSGCCQLLQLAAGCYAWDFHFHFHFSGEKNILLYISSSVLHMSLLSSMN